MPKHTIRRSDKKQTKSVKSEPSSSNTRKPVACYCDQCNGKKVDPRTRKKHQLEPATQSTASKKHKVPIVTKKPEIDSSSSSSSSTSSPNDDKEGYQETKKTRKRYDQFHSADIEINQGEEPILSSRSSNDDDGDDDGDDEEDLSYDEDHRNLSDFFSAPDLNDTGSELDPEVTNFDDLWILLWIFKYQERFRLSNVAIDSLVKFFRLILLDVNLERFKKFPSSAYAARQTLEIGRKTKMFAVYPECNKLHNTEYNGQSVLKCDHVEFPNHPMRNQRKACGTEVMKKVPTVNGYIWRPKLVFSLPDLKYQLATFFQRPGFEQQILKWTNRDVRNGLMSDIYEGRVWKTFPSSLDDQNSRFFTPETADSNLGIIINLDWFQPFESSVYSTGAIYGVICNLPRDVRFKKENMLILGLLPGPQEVKTHRINHFLAPIVDELLELWNGFDLPVSAKFLNGKKIRVAVICCSNDIPAVRKLCGHISAVAACHRCHKWANSDNTGKTNYGGFEDMSSWFTIRDPAEH